MPGRFCFTFLRSPRERLVSLYSFCRKQKPADHILYQAANETDLEGFLRLADSPKLEMYLRNNMVWQMTVGLGHELRDGRQRFWSEFSEAGLLSAACANLETFDYVGLTETADQDIGTIFRRLGVPDAVAGHENASSSPSTVEGLPATTRRLLADLTHLDQRLYDHVLNEKRARGWAQRIGRRLGRSAAPWH